MKHPILFMALLACVVGCSPYKYETVKGDPLNTKIYTLDNGLKVFMTVNKETPRIQTYIAVHVGGKNDPSETTGLAHYFEHLMFKGTEQFGTSDYQAEKPLLDQIESLFELYRNTTDEAQRVAIYHQIDSVSYEASKIAIPNEYDKLMSIIGADGTNAWTSQDETVYTEDIPSNQIDNWARIQADRFRHCVVRGFHTELETIYEEKNMSLTQDNRKVWEEIDNALYPHHPYGQQTVLGTQDHLKNPSITNVKKYHDTYYVPNNIAICVSGDFKPDEMVAAIEKYFGTWEPNPDIPELEYQKEAPIEAPIVRTVYGLESEFLAMAWPYEGANDLHSYVLSEVVSSVLNNGNAGLVDLDVMQQQKVLSLFCGTNAQPDYSYFMAMGRPKNGQSLEQVRDITLEEFRKLRQGDFDEQLIPAIVNNMKLGLMESLEDNEQRAQYYVNAFINNIPWSEAAHMFDMYDTITKDEVVEWANKYLRDDNYAIVYKRIGEDKTVRKISAPKITPIVTNRDNTSDFLTEIQNTPVKPIEPVYVNFDKDMSRFDLSDGIEVLYKKNELNKTFSLNYIFNVGSEEDPALPLSSWYIDYLGTPSVCAEDFAVQMYSLACSFSVSTSSNKTTISISGLSENMTKAISLVEDKLLNAEGDANILANIKSDFRKNRTNNKLSQRACFNALGQYMMYGGEFIQKTTLSDAELDALTSDELLGKISALFGKSHDILVYTSDSEKSVRRALEANHHIEENLEKVEETFPTLLQTPSNSVVLAQYDAKQLYYNQYSNRGEKFCPEDAPQLQLYRMYFGGGMNSIVFQEMREARGLAYSASASLRQPSNIDGTYSFSAFIATQNDKMRTAIEAFDEIINDMPKSEAAFSVAKNALDASLRTDRTVGMSVLNSYLNCRRMGLKEPLTKEIFEGIQTMTLDDVAAAQLKWIKGRSYTYGILGDIKDLDTEYLKTLGPVKEVSLEEIFGY